MDTGLRKSEDNITKGLRELHKRRVGPHAIHSTTNTDILRFGIDVNTIRGRCSVKPKARGQREVSSTRPSKTDLMFFVARIWPVVM